MYFRISRVHLERKMNTEIIQSLHHDSQVTQNVNNSEHNIIWFDGEVCTIIILF